MSINTVEFAEKILKLFSEAIVDSANEIDRLRRKIERLEKVVEAARSMAHYVEKQISYYPFAPGLQESWSKFKEMDKSAEK